MTELKIIGSLAHDIEVIHSRLHTPIPLRWSSHDTVEVVDCFAEVAAIKRTIRHRGVLRSLLDTLP